MNKKTKKLQSRSVETRKKLLEVGIEAFASKGFEGVGTRELADRAGVNLSAIRYHFGDKKGLYRAVIKHISESVHQRIAPFIDQVRIRIERPGTTRDDLISTLCHLVTSFSAQLLGSDISDNWARLVTREQVSPTDAFPVMYRVFRLLTDMIADIIARLSERDPNSEEVRISAMAMIGQVTIFRTHRATAMNFIGWKKLGEREVSILRSVLTVHCRAMMASDSQ